MPVPTASLAQRLRPLLARYDARAPRYTSYPPIPYWGALDAATVEGWLGEPVEAGRSLSLCTHVPFCRSRCHFCACHVVITPHAEPAQRYVGTVLREMERVAGLLGAPRRVRQYHLGGGTPNALAPAELDALLERARALFDFEPDAELSLEADPRHLTPALLRYLRALGFNRLSLGIQDLHPQVQAGCNRVEPEAHVALLMEAAHALGFQSVNVDLIYGLPHQTQARFAHTVTRMIALGPERLALYNFAYLPQAFPHQRRLDAAALPDAEEKLAIFLAARERLLAAGYVAIGMDHFALAHDALALAWRNGTLRRNFMGYTPQAGTDLVGFGVSAISECDGRFWQNEKKLVRYQRAVDAGRLAAVRGMALDADDRARQALVGALFCQGRVNFAQLDARHPGRVWAALASAHTALAPLERDGLLRLDGGALEVTELGQFFLRTIAMAFDPRTQAGAAGQSAVQFSRTA